MKVFLAGARSALGRRLIPQLLEAGHRVTGLTRHPQAAAELLALGAQSAIGDGLNRTSVMGAVAKSEPDVIIHQMTHLAGIKSFKRFDDDFALTNRLRTEGLDHLVEAAQETGVRRIVAQSYGNWNYERTGGPVKHEDDPLDPSPPSTMSRTLDAIRYLESSLMGMEGIEGVALRYGNFYGPGTSWADNGSLVKLVGKRRLPIIGMGTGVWSFIHLDDAAGATVAAIERGAPGIYNVCDDEPAPVSVWLPELAKVLGAKPPRRVPGWLGRLAAGEAGVSMFTRIRGASNEKAKQELGWTLTYPTWREGFRSGLSDSHEIN